MSTSIWGKETKTSREEERWEDKLSGYQIRGWRAVSVAGLQGEGSPKMRVRSQTLVIMIIFTSFIIFVRDTLSRGPLNKNNEIWLSIDDALVKHTYEQIEGPPIGVPKKYYE